MSSQHVRVVCRREESKVGSGVALIVLSIFAFDGRSVVVVLLLWCYQTVNV